MGLKYLLLLPILMNTFCLNAQDVESHDDNHDHANNEVGIANSVVYFTKAKEFAYGFHLHYIHYVSHTKFGYGIGYERIFDEHGHNTIGVIGTYSPVNGLLFGLSPGITFEDNHSSDLYFALHFETTYEFDIGNFHIGPVLSVAYDPEDYHLGMGVHIGYGF